MIQTLYVVSERKSEAGNLFSSLLGVTEIPDVEIRPGSCPSFESWKINTERPLFCISMVSWFRFREKKFWLARILK